jgi:glutathione synthase/RimK-type ligase-like ATP-grasp enzyme
VILVLSNQRDRLPEPVIATLQRKGAACIRFDTEQFPQQRSLTIAYDNGGRDSLLLRGPDVDVDLSAVTAVWNRRPVAVIPDSRLAPEDHEFVRRESQHTLNALYYCLNDRFWINPYDPAKTAEHKPYQLKVAKALGFDVPRTLITNDPSLVMDFHASCPRGLVYKTLNAHSRPDKRWGLGIFTNRVSQSDLERRLNGVSLAPCIFQEYIEKAVELRVTVIGHQIFTCRLDSQSLEATRDDWRRTVLYGRIPHTPADIPDDLKVRIHRLLDALGLLFGCLDFIVTPEGRHVFLEINPNGQWLWIEHETGLPLMEAFTEMLIQRRPDYSMPAACAGS